MPSDLSAAVQEVETLESLDENELYSRLGKNLQAREEDPYVGLDFTADVSRDEEPIAAFAIRRIDIGDIVDFFRNWGKKFFSKVNKEFLSVLCGDDEDYEDARERLKSWIETGREALLPGLIVILSGGIFGLAPATAAIVAALLLKVTIKAGTAATCEVWEGASG